MEMEAFFITLGLNIISERLDGRRDGFPFVVIQRNMDTGCANLALCKTQQGYSPPGEGETLPASLKISATGLAEQSFAKLKIAAARPLSLGRVALLGIAQRTVSIKFAPNQKKKPRAKALPESIQTIGDWIQAMRAEKNLTPGHLAAKMGIAAGVVRSWESGTSQPDDRQLKVLANLLGFDPTQGNAVFASI